MTHEPAQPPVPPAPPQPPAPASMQPMSPQQLSPEGHPAYPAVYAVKPPMLPVAVISLALSILGFMTGWIYWIGIPLAVGAVACGHVALYLLGRSTIPRSGRALAITGLYIGYAAILFDVIWIVMVRSLFSALS